VVGCISAVVEAEYKSIYPRLFFRHTLHEERLALLNLANVLVTKAKPALEMLAPSYITYSTLA